MMFAGVHLLSLMILDNRSVVFRIFNLTLQVRLKNFLKDSSFLFASNHLKPMQNTFSSKSEQIKYYGAPPPLNPRFVRGYALHTPASYIIGLYPLSQLVIGYHWLFFENSPQFTKNFEYKIDHISNTKNRFCIRFRTLRIFWKKKILDIFLVKILSILSLFLKTRNLKIVFS